MKRQKPTVRDGVLRTGGLDVRVASADFQHWLNANRSFVFEGEFGRFSARRETRRGQFYWYAYRRQDGKLRKAYLGRAEDLTLAQLQSADAKLAGQEIAPPAQTTHTPVITKHFPPRQPDNLLRRDRLLKQFKTPLVLLHAPMGFGKSTLLAQWSQQTTKPIAWATLDSADNIPTTFLQTISNALATILPDNISQLSPLPATPDWNQLQAAITTILHKIMPHRDPFALVLDDYHLITSEQNQRMTRFLIDYLPPTMQLVISSAERPPFPLNQWRMLGIVTEIDEGLLRLTAEESHHFLQQHVAVSPARLRQITRQTGGWPAGLRLAALALQHDTPFTADKRLGEGAYFSSFFIESVLSQQPQTVQTFLLYTSILNRLHADLCDVLTSRHDSQSQLESLWQGNLFIAKLDGESVWYQYHTLFADALRQACQRRFPDMIGTLHRQAAAWYQQNQLPEEAVHHLMLIEDWVAAAALLETIAYEELRDQGEDHRLLRWVQQLPVEIVQQHAALLRTYLRLTNLSLLPTQQTRFVQEVKARIMAKDVAARSAEDRAILAEIEQGRDGDVSAEIHYPTKIDTFFDQLNTLNNSVNAIFSNQFQLAEHQLSHLLEQAQVDNHLYLGQLTGNTLAYVSVTQGRLEYAKSICQELLDWVWQRLGRWPALASTLMSTLGWVAYEQNRLADALEWLNQAHEINPNPVIINILVWNFMLQARTYTAQGNIEQGMAMLAAAEQLDLTLDTGMWVREDIVLARARCYALADDIPAASRLLADCQPAIATNEQLHDAANIMRAEIYLAQADFAEAETVLLRLTEGSTSGFRMEPILRPHVMLAVALMGQHKVNAAQKLFEGALRLASAENFRRPFIERGAALLPLLALTLQAGRLSAETHRFAQHINTTLQTAAEVVPSQRELADLQIAAAISKRELEVLQLVSAGLSNQEIAAQLLITQSTVHSHLKRIYRKLDVHSRTEAVMRGLALNLPLR